MLASRGGIQRNLAMKMRWGTYHNHVEVVHLKHLAIISEMVGNAMAFGKGCGIARRGGSHRNHLRILAAMKGFRMDGGNKLRTNQPHFHGAIAIAAQG
jgi:hypothetical protein